MVAVRMNKYTQGAHKSYFIFSVETDKGMVNSSFKTECNVEIMLRHSKDSQAKIETKPKAKNLTWSA